MIAAPPAEEGHRSYASSVDCNLTAWYSAAQDAVDALSIDVDDDGDVPHGRVGLDCSTRPTSDTPGEVFVGLPQDVDPAEPARMIAGGHAWEHFKHLSGFDDPSDLEDLLRAVFASPSEVKGEPGGKVAFLG